jgi:hypothetical protein
MGPGLGIEGSGVASPVQEAEMDVGAVTYASDPVGSQKSRCRPIGDLELVLAKLAYEHFRLGSRLIESSHELGVPVGNPIRLASAGESGDTHAR